MSTLLVKPMKAKTVRSFGTSTTERYRAISAGGSSSGPIEAAMTNVRLYLSSFRRRKDSSTSMKYCPGSLCQ